MIKKTNVGLMLLLPVLLSSAACSVKEQRDGCPCRLVLDFTDVDTLAHASVRVSVSDAAGAVYERSSASGGLCPEFGISIPVRKIASIPGRESSFHMVRIVRPSSCILRQWTQDVNQ